MYGSNILEDLGGLRLAMLFASQQVWSNVRLKFG